MRAAPGPRLASCSSTPRRATWRTSRVARRPHRAQPGVGLDPGRARRSPSSGTPPGLARARTSPTCEPAGRRIVPIGYGQLSNDGTRIVGPHAARRDRTWLCVAPIAGGPCEPISEPYPRPVGDATTAGRPTTSGSSRSARTTFARPRPGRPARRSSPPGSSMARESFQRSSLLDRADAEAPSHPQRTGRRRADRRPHAQRPASPKVIG